MPPNPFQPPRSEGGTQHDETSRTLRKWTIVWGGFRQMTWYELLDLAIRQRICASHSFRKQHEPAWASLLLLKGGSIL